MEPNKPFRAPAAVPSLMLPRNALMDVIHGELLDQGSFEAAKALTIVGAPAVVPPSESLVEALETYSEVAEALGARPFIHEALEEALSSCMLSPASIASLWQVAVTKLVVLVLPPTAASSPSSLRVTEASLNDGKQVLYSKIFPSSKRRP
jgi:hypothetical protein